jgi:hypothetical protein
METPPVLSYQEGENQVTSPSYQEGAGGVV